MLDYNWVMWVSMKDWLENMLDLSGCSQGSWGYKWGKWGCNQEMWGYNRGKWDCILERSGCNQGMMGCNQGMMDCNQGMKWERKPCHPHTEKIEHL